MSAWCRSALLAVVAGSLLGLSACYPTAKHVTTASDEVGVPQDRVGVDDTFDVRVYGETELSGMFRVATDGTVDYPLAGRLQVAGLRTGEIQQLLVDKLKDRYL